MVGIGVTKERERLVEIGRVRKKISGKGIVEELLVRSKGAQTYIE